MGTENVSMTTLKQSTKFKGRKNPLERFKYLIKGVLLTLILALIASQISKIPYFSIIGIMVLSIILGIAWKCIMDVPFEYTKGISFSSKYLLRLGIIFMGIRLNFHSIIKLGSKVMIIDITVIVFTIMLIILLGKLLKVDPNLAALIGVGTAVCGAAAIVAIAPLMKAKQEHTALAVAIVAILGTAGTILYTCLYTTLGVNPKTYGILVGSTLHEIAHVIAAAAPSGKLGSETALVTKLGRVALLIPVALTFAFLYNKNNQLASPTDKWRNLPIPWFIFGFLGFSLLNTFVKLPPVFINGLISLSVMLMSMAMAGLGLGVNIADFKKAGFKPIALSLIGFAFISLLGVILLKLV